MKKTTPENLVKAEIKDWLSLNGWFHFPLTQGLGSTPGLPDRIAIKSDVVLFIEIKAKHGKQSPAQKIFGDNIKYNGGLYILAKGYEDIEKYLKQKG